jgi:hypothetical protein
VIIPIYGSIKKYAEEKVRLNKIGKPQNDEFDLLIGVTAIENEIQRVAGYDPRIQIFETQVFPQENGILIQVQLAVVPNSTAQQLSIFFNQQQRRASYI